MHEGVFIHETADVSTQHVGAGSRIWQFVVVLPGAKIGKDCNICAQCLIENDVVVGNNVTVKSGVQLWDGLRVEDDVFIGPNATFTNDKHPRSKVYPDKFENTVISKGASIGANATILPGITIGAGALVGAGAVVTKDVPPGAIVKGNPARLTGYAGSMSAVSLPVERIDADRLPQCRVKGVSLHLLNKVVDARGELCAGEFGKELPFAPKRLFFVYGVPSEKVRGAHAHRNCHQFLICMAGSLELVVDDGESRQSFRMDDPRIGVYLKPGVWGVQYRYSSDAILAVLASDPYDESDYLRDYDAFLEHVSGS